MLVMLSGLPGVGKSIIANELARRMGATVVSVDPIEDAIIEAGLPMSFETGVAAYTVGAAIARAQLGNRLRVIADAANYLEVGRDVWRAAAAATDSPLSVVEVVCRDEEEHRRRLHSRQRGLAHYPEPTWPDIIQRRRESDPWSEDRLVLDASEPVADNVDRALLYVEAYGRPRVRWEVRKWDGHLHRAVDATLLAEDETGMWLHVPPGTHVERPCGEDFDHPCDATVYLPWDSMWHVTWLTNWDVPLYVDIAQSAERSGNTVTTVDLDLDLIRWWDGRVELLDEDEFADNQVTCGYPPELVAKIHSTVGQLRPRLMSAESPFASCPVLPVDRR